MVREDHCNTHSKKLITTTRDTSQYLLLSYISDSLRVSLMKCACAKGQCPRAACRAPPMPRLELVAGAIHMLAGCVSFTD